MVGLVEVAGVTVAGRFEIVWSYFVEGKLIFHHSDDYLTEEFGIGFVMCGLRLLFSV